ncbi:hypothetical protein LAY57_32770, partial [Argonema antarcticum A004/B2]|nr:hypothetical protein [Argonema antarcticum A004/B2]
MTLGYLPRGLTAPSDVGIQRAANLKSLESTDSNGVEQDGIPMEVVVQPLGGRQQAVKPLLRAGFTACCQKKIG